MKIYEALTSPNPDAVMVYSNAEDARPAAVTLIGYMKNCRIMPSADDTIDFIKASKPSVLLFALENIKSSVRFYKECLDFHKIKHKHKAIVLCTNRESGIAYTICQKGMFDDYFVFKPIYEKHRLKMLVHNAIVDVKSNEEIEERINNDSMTLSKELTELLDEGLSCRSKIIQSVERCKKALIESSDGRSEEAHLSSLEDRMEGLQSEIHQGFSEILLQMQNLKTDNEKQRVNLGEEDLVNKLSQLTAGLSSNQRTATAEPPVEKPAESVEEAPQVVVKERNEEEIVEAPVPAEETADALYVGKKVIVVEDNAIYRKMVSKVLEDAKVNVEEAEDGLAALQKIKTMHYDAIIMDLFMPKLDGLKTTQMIRLSSHHQNIPIIALTANKDKSLIRQWASHKLAGYISKPSKKSVILGVLEKALAGEEPA